MPGYLVKYKVEPEKYQKAKMITEDQQDKYLEEGKVFIKLIDDNFMETGKRLIKKEKDLILIGYID